ncbi:hypothetical protein, partial [Corynebacterium falsenii]|uniref:hypothetical protein n=1 Tax=Corynebacterium falsenii TaxID=108486 RepID=UPI001E02C920
LKPAHPLHSPNEATGSKMCISGNLFAAYLLHAEMGLRMHKAGDRQARKPPQWQAQREVKAPSTPRQATVAQTKRKAKAA